MHLDFFDASFERASPLDRFDLLLGVEATFEIVVEDRLLYREGRLPVVELREQLVRRVRGGLTKREDFTYDRLESGELGFVWIRRDSEEGWRVGSVHQEYIEMAIRSDGQVSEAIARFAEEVDEWVKSNLHVRVDQVTGS